MTRMVTCRKYGQSLPGLSVPPLPGAKGQKLFDEISQKPGKNGYNTKPDSSMKNTST